MSDLDHVDPRGEDVRANLSQVVVPQVHLL